MPLERGVATYSSILARRIPGTEEPGGYIVHGVVKSQTLLTLHFETSLIGSYQKIIGSNWVLKNSTFAELLQLFLGIM